MSVPTKTRESLRFWGPTGLAGAASAGLVGVLVTAVCAPAFAAPAEHLPADTSYTVLTTGYEGLTVPCFMGRQHWADALAGPPPVCTL